LPLTADWTPGPIGQSFTLGAPPWSNQVTMDQSTSIVIPAGVPARITATGTLMFAVNDGYVQCANGQNPPSLPGGLASVGPNGFPSYPAAWRLEVRDSGSASTVTWVPGDPAASPVVAYVQGPKKLYAGRSQVFPYACGTPGGGTNPAYSVSGSQTITAEALDSAHIVPDKQVVVPGDTVTFTVQVSWSTDIHVFGAWRWVSDTTTNNTTWTGQCWHSTSCKAVVRERGHAELDQILVEGNITLAARSLVIAVVPPQLLVDCAGSGSPRGSTVTCHARPYPSSESFSVSGWTFTSTAGDVVTRTANQSDSTWAGTLVVDGRIDVTGVVAGQGKAGTANVTVTPRDWSGKAVRSTHATPGADVLPVRPDSFSQLGRTSMWMLVRPDPQNYAVVITDGGPNDSFTYMTDIPFETFDTARVNYPAMAQGSDWYAIQYAQDTQVGGTTYCGQGRVLTLPPLVEAHEGTDPPSEPNSHVGIYVNDVNRLAPEPSEALAGKNPNPEPVRAPIDNAAFADSRAMDTDSRNNIVLPCVFIYDYSRLH